MPCAIARGATEAYGRLTEDRLLSLRESRVEGFSTMQAFIERRLQPAMRTCEAASRRLDDLSQRIGRVSDLLRARISISLEVQNQDLLKSMDLRSKLQVKLQGLVEGLSVFAVSYYAFSLVKIYHRCRCFSPAWRDLLYGPIVLAILAGAWLFIHHRKKAIGGDRGLAGWLAEQHHRQAVLGRVADLQAVQAGRQVEIDDLVDGRTVDMGVVGRGQGLAAADHVEPGAGAGGDAVGSGRCDDQRRRAGEGAGPGLLIDQARHGFDGCQLQLYRQAGGDHGGVAGEGRRGVEAGGIVGQGRLAPRTAPRPGACARAGMNVRTAARYIGCMAVSCG
ncbi:MAG: DUF3422 family protein [Asticcacaulis sp.]